MVWARRLSHHQIERVRAKDKADKDAYIAAVNWQKAQKIEAESLLRRLWRRFVDWCRS
ncbi:hypothetical protein GMLC_13740 [Geomonas limicola]|uniref:Uncharacterized protein n=1 Tax=Geomonas limicola TaxID=2740186 RepID=A0A6V8N5F4_9BACT|nr:hypothetical protein GMLC_13740 [Geomonas limicola]